MYLSYTYAMYLPYHIEKKDNQRKNKTKKEMDHPKYGLKILVICFFVKDPLINHWFPLMRPAITPLFLQKRTAGGPAFSTWCLIYGLVMSNSFPPPPLTRCLVRNSRFKEQMEEMPWWGEERGGKAPKKSSCCLAMILAFNEHANTSMWS